jgi:serine O-acetyltransferase
MNRNIEHRSFFCELKQDLKANGWTNGKATTFLSVCFFSLGFHTLLFYRICVRLDKIPFIGYTLRRFVSLLAKIMTACDINSFAKLEGGISIPHSTGIVIGRGAAIKTGTTLYQNVTIGSKKGDSGAGTIYPFIDSNVTVYSGAVIGGPYHIGENAVIGANAVIIKDIPANATAVGIPAKVIR